ncbi:MAG: hypothetical protein ACRD4V_14735 [Candidatus Acidiferrales bacterium]
MKALGTRLALQASVLLLLFLAAVPLRAQDYFGFDLHVCNKGTVPVEVVTAQKNEFPMLYWDVTSTPVTPGECKGVYESSAAYAAYIAFGFADAKGQWGSGKIAQVPDFGVFVSLPLDKKVLTGTAVALCAQKDGTSYRSWGDLPANCAGLKYVRDWTGHLIAPDVRYGPLLPLTSALFIETGGKVCIDSWGNRGGCTYYLNIAPSATGRELNATQGTASGADDAASDDQSMQILAKLFKAVINAADAQSKQRAQAKLDAAEARLKHTREQQGAREQKQKQILAADAAGNPDAKIPAQMVRREQENNRQRWAGTRQSPAAYDPQWMGQNLVVVGTVSRVEVDPNGSPNWVTIYFKESPNATFVVCSPYPDLFQERVGLNLNALVGKTLEAAGQVELPYCGGNAPKGSIRVVESTQWHIH